MEYKDILDEQKKLLRDELKWWPDYLYHFTDVHNASSILYSGWIYSREQATEKHIMVNDNASRAVIEATRNDSKCYGRLYFRPLTPTQFHNEGYKPVEMRKSDIDACCPIPVFLCLNAEATLNFPGTEFAERGISGNRHNIKAGINEFQKLNFSKIYHEGWFSPENRDIVEFRHSEVIREGGFPVAPLIQWIICRTEAEKETLLFLLKQYSVRLYNTYKDSVIYNPMLKCFFNNGIFIKKTEIYDATLIISFNDPEQRFKGTDDRHADLKVAIEVAYKKANGSIVAIDNGYCNLDYFCVRSCTMKLSETLEYDIARVTVRLNDTFMYENDIVVRDMLF